MNLNPAAQALSAEEERRQKGGAISRFFFSHPTGFWFFFWGEFAERCSYYGMKAILAKYIADQLTMGQDKANAYVHTFIAACYFLPLIGGWVADNIFGKYWTIVGFSIPYILGHVILGVEDYWFMVVALTLLAMGSGVIKPNISTLMGLTYDQQRPGQTKLRSDAFSMFYFAINIGAAISQFAMPPIRSAHGYAIAFLFPAALMVVAFLIFAAGKRYYAIETISRASKPPAERAEQWRVLRRILGLFVLVMFFWAIFDQSSTTWIFFTEACMNRHIFGYKMDADQMQFFNPVLILLLLPPITLSYKYLDSRGFTVRPTDKMIVGFVLTAGCMGVMALAAWMAGAAELRPGIVQAKEKQHLRLVLKGSDREITVEKELKVEATEQQTVVAMYQIKDESGKKTVATHELTLVGRDVLKLRAPHKDGADETTEVRIEGQITKVEETVTEGKREQTQILLEGNIQARIEGDMNVSQRWFVAPGDQVTVWWLVLGYIVITVAEVLISVTGLELAYAAAPKSMTGFVTACWLLTVGLANLVINVPVTQLYTKMQPMAYFGMLALTLLIVSVAFVGMARRFNRQSQETVTA